MCMKNEKGSFAFKLLMRLISAFMRTEESVQSSNRVSLIKVC